MWRRELGAAETSDCRFQRTFVLLQLLKIYRHTLVTKHSCIFATWGFAKKTVCIACTYQQRKYNNRSLRGAHERKFMWKSVLSFWRECGKCSRWKHSGISVVKCSWNFGRNFLSKCEKRVFRINKFYTRINPNRLSYIEVHKNGGFQKLIKSFCDTFIACWKYWTNRVKLI